MKRRKLQTQVRQRQIVQTALDVLATSGPRALSMANVASRCDLVPSAIYRHFRSKDAMLWAAIERVEEMLLSNVEAASRASADGMAQLHDLLRRHIRMLRENLAIPRVVFDEDTLGPSPKRKKRVRQILASYLQGIAEMVRRGQRSGSVSRKVDPSGAAILFLGIIQPAAIMWHLSDGKFDVQAHAEKAWKLFEKALGS